MTDRGCDLAGQLDDLVMRTGDTRPGEDRDRSCPVDRLGHLGDVIGMGCQRRLTWYVPRRRRADGVELRDIARQDSNRHTVPAHGMLHRRLDDPRCLLGESDQLGVMRALEEHAFWMGLLEVPHPDL